MWQKKKFTFFNTGSTATGSLKSGAYIPVMASALIVVGVVVGIYKYRHSQYAALSTVEDGMDSATEHTPLVAM